MKNKSYRKSMTNVNPTAAMRRQHTGSTGHTRFLNGIAIKWAGFRAALSPNIVSKNKDKKKEKYYDCF